MTERPTDPTHRTPTGRSPETAPGRALHRTLRVTADRVALLDDDRGGEPIATGAPPHPGHGEGKLDPGLDETLWELGRARRGTSTEEVALRSPQAARAAGGPERAPLHRHLKSAGSELERCFLPAEILRGLAREVERADRTDRVLELGFDLDPDFDALPWEALQLPTPAGSASGSEVQDGEPLAIHPTVRMFRKARGDRPIPDVDVPPPLRVLVAIGSPESQNRPGELLDYENELEKILESMERARRENMVYVRVLHRGTVREIREALRAQRFHVLYISCHAVPDALILEDAEGNEDRVDADRLWREALPTGRKPPFVVLAGCATGLPGQREQETGEDHPLPGLARGLLAKGVPAVLAMQAPVSDLYATFLAEELFSYLSRAQAPEPLAALSEARLLVELQRRRNEEYQHLAEWATPALYRTGPALRLYDPTAPRETISEPPPPRLTSGIVVHAVGDFVGRRREERLVLKALRQDQGAGVLLHGMGGVGKSTLAAQVLGRLSEDRWILASVANETGPEDLLDEVGFQLWDHYIDQEVPEDDPRRRVINEIRRRDLPWEDRFRLLDSRILGQTPILVLIDNFEDNLVVAEDDGEAAGYLVKEPALAEILTEWLRRPGKSRLLITSRYPFTLPRKTHRKLERLHLGPLSWAETRKLMYRLPALDRLSRDEQKRAYRDMGGHPRTLEYLDALLRSDEELEFNHVVERLEDALEKEGIERPADWMRTAAGDLDEAFEKTVTLAADDILLPELLKQVEKVPLAKELLIGASVYRIPVDEVGLMFQVGEMEEDEEAS